VAVNKKHPLDAGLSSTVTVVSIPYSSKDVSYDVIWQISMLSTSFPSAPVSKSKK